LNTTVPFGHSPNGPTDSSALPWLFSFRSDEPATIPFGVVTWHESGCNACAAGKAPGVPIPAGRAKTARLATVNTTNFGIGPFDRNQNVLDIQPVIPIRVSRNWNMIIRWIAPVIWQPAPGTANLQVFGIDEYTPAYLTAEDVQAHAGVFGLGDMTPTFFLSPAKPHKLIWGVGPVFVVPTATGRALGQGKLSAGPSIVALVQPGHWTIGALINNVWSMAGPSSRIDVNQMTLQHFVNYNLKKGWYVSLSPIVTANWNAMSDNVWTVPVGGGMGRVFRLGFQLVNVSAAFNGNVVHPADGSPWEDAATNCVPVSEAARTCQEKLRLKSTTILCDPSMVVYLSFLSGPLYS
jgi:hypothetical protein